MNNKLLVRVFLILIAFWTPNYFSNAQNKPIIFDHITSLDGLTSNRVQCIHRDGKEYIWIGTDMGLNRYNGQRIAKYLHDDQKGGTISVNNILCITEDRENQLWIGTSGGLNLYDPALDNFTVFKHDAEDSTSISSNYIISGYCDRKGNLWFLAGGNCLNLWNPGKHNFIRYNLREPDNDYPTIIEAIAEDSKGNLWITGHFSGIYRFNTESKRVQLFSDSKVDFGINTYNSLFIDKQDIIWIASNGNGLYSFNPLTGEVVHFGTQGKGIGTNHNMLRWIEPENDRFLLIGTDQGGINRFDKQRKQFEYITYDENNPDGLNNNGIWTLYIDKEGILWVGTANRGVNYFNPKKDKFKLFRHNNDSKRSTSHNVIGCFYEDSDGMIWIGTDGGGINVYDPKTGLFKVFRHNPSDPYSVSGDIIRCISEDKDYDLWIGTWDAGLNRYDRTTGKFYRYMPNTNDPASISGKKIWHLTIDNNGYIWLAIMDEGIDILDKNKGVIKRFKPNPNDPKALSSNVIWLLVEDWDQNMWICSWQGLYRYNKINNSFIAYKNFPDNDIRAFCKDREGNLWAGSATQGLFLFNLDGYLMKKFNHYNGLPNNQINAIVEDNKGKLWISTNMGISQFDPETVTFRNYTVYDGLQDNQFFYQSFLKTRTGEIYFGGFNGFNSFFPDSFKDNDFLPPVYIDEFQIFNKPVPYGVKGSVLQSHISEAKAITLSWRQSVFSFGFSAINYTYPEKNLYQYMMEGFDKSWNSTDASRRYTTYTNLNPGKYIFRVKASNNDGIWNEAGTSINITILPPWWKTWFSRIFFVLSIIGISFGFYFYRINRLEKQKDYLESLVKERTREVEEKNTILEERQQQIEEQAEELRVNSEILTETNEQLMAKQEMIIMQAENLKETNQKLTVLNATKDKFFSIIAHDLKNPFNSILGFSEILLTKFKNLTEEKKQKYIEYIYESSQRIYRLLENLLQWASTQTGNIHFNPEVFDLSEVVDANYNLVKEILEKKKIVFVKNIPDNTRVFADRNMINTVVRNLLGNASKFTKNGEISIDIKTNKDYLEIRIADSGIGIPENKLASIFEMDQAKSTKGTANETGTGLGLILCKEFIEKNNGKIWVESEEGKGSEFKFTLPKV
jgi:signal transduction histidine kinase/ligand-binding sensor domain-containing protein